MRFLQTADWHLGLLFHQHSLIEDQAYVLARIVEIAREAEPDVILLPGDLFDRPVPSVEAIELFEDIIAELTLKLGIRVIASRGNHENDSRFQFGARFFAKANFHLVGEITEQPTVFELADAHGPVHVGVIPYAVPSICREIYKDESLADHDKAMAAITARLRARIPAGVRSVVMAHAYVEGGRGSESERELTVGGSGAVDARHFDGFHYVALGHLHAPQYVGRKTIHYAGSLLKYSFSEAQHIKSVSLIEMDEKGDCHVATIALPAKRDVRILHGSLADLIAVADGDPGRGDFIKAVLTDEGALIDPLQQLRERYPNTLEVVRATPFVAPGELVGLSGDHRAHAVRDILKAFYRDVRGAPPTEAESAVLDEAIEGIRQSDGGGAHET